MKSWLKISIAAAFFALFAVQAQAQTATSSFTVTATVSSNCTISTVGITFGSYDPVVANATNPLDSNGTVTVACTAGASTTVGMDQGSFPTGTSTAAAPARQMDSGTAQLSYALYQDAARTTVWGDVGTPSVVTYNSTSTTPTTINIYGRIPGGQDADTGTYTDTVTATVSF
ncbi:MAG: spore coat protein U domain-containing protein [Myxococcales bacterium]|nr:MAG: spore coat protein U domain-containing protein [Myxococcales bacterium]